jgi:hypothetical protein
VAATAVAGCQLAPLDGRPCHCATGYTCCESTQICVSSAQRCVDLGAWPALPVTPDGTPPVPMDDVTVFAFSTVDPNGSDAMGMGRDEQVLALNPDMVIRGWGQWGGKGTFDVDYETSFIQECQAPEHGIRFMGGGTATALFSDQAPDIFDRVVTRDASGQPVLHDDLNIGEYRGSLASPEFRKYLVGIGELQIKHGVDGLQYSDVNAGYQGSPSNTRGVRDGNEGFDGYHLADFNAFLLAKYPGMDYRQFFQMPGDNFLRDDVMTGDLTRNFNFARYLQAKGGKDALGSPNDLLVNEWGRTLPDRPAFGAQTFVDTAEPYRYWREIVTRLRGIAHDQGRDRFYISANGMFPFVDFVSASVYDSPEIAQSLFTFLDSPYRLNGTVSVKKGLINLRQQAALVAPGAPVVVYQDGPWLAYHGLPLDQRLDFWRLYAAEAYANGLYFAFLLKPPISGRNSTRTFDIVSPTATMDGTFGLFLQLAAFYRGHGGLYHGTMRVDPAVEDLTVTTLSGPVHVTVSIADQPASDVHPARRIVHLVNHEYDPDRIGSSGIKLLSNVTVTIPVASDVVTSVLIASPDSTGDALVTPTPVPSNGTITVTLPSLFAYDAVVISY